MLRFLQIQSMQDQLNTTGVNASDSEAVNASDGYKILASLQLQMLCMQRNQMQHHEQCGF